MRELVSAACLTTRRRVVPEAYPANSKARNRHAQRVLNLRSVKLTPSELAQLGIFLSR